MHRVARYPPIIRESVVDRAYDGRCVHVQLSPSYRIIWRLELFSRALPLRARPAASLATGARARPASCAVARTTQRNAMPGYYFHGWVVFFSPFVTRSESKRRRCRNEALCHRKVNECVLAT